MGKYVTSHVNFGISSHKYGDQWDSNSLNRDLFIEISRGFIRSPAGMGL
jgi:hypothetical protein